MSKPTGAPIGRRQSAPITGRNFRPRPSLPLSARNRPCLPQSADHIEEGEIEVNELVLLQLTYGVFPEIMIAEMQFLKKTHLALTIGTDVKTDYTGKQFFYPHLKCLPYLIQNGLITSDDAVCLFFLQQNFTKFYVENKFSTY